MDKKFLDQLNWRFATKKFDPEKKVSDTDLAKILEAIRMAPTSHGLQPFHVYLVTDELTRKAIQEHSDGQAQVIDASHVLVFAAYNTIDQRIDQYIDLISSGDNTLKLKLEPRKETLKRTLSAFTDDGIKEWCARQMYIALGFGLAACAELGIDSCPMEGFDTAGVDILLAMPKHMRSVVYVTIGYRKEDPLYPKSRFPEGDLFTTR